MMRLPSWSLAIEHGEFSSAWDARPPIPLVPGSPIPAFVVSHPVRSFSSLITAPVLACPVPESANSRRPPVTASGAHGADNVTCRAGPGPPAPPAKTVAVPGRGAAAGTASATPAASTADASTPEPKTLASSRALRRSPSRCLSPHPPMTSLPPATAAY